jgi:hypothetical protein
MLSISIVGSVSQNLFPNYWIMESLSSLKDKFKWETWIELFDAMQLYYWEYNSEYFCYDDDSASILDSEWLKRTVEDLKALCLQKNYLKNKLEMKHIQSFADISDCKCEHPERTRHSWMYTSIKPFLNEDLIRKNLCEEQAICWNPYWILNHPDSDRCLCLFKPSETLLKRYSFIKKSYSWLTRIVLYYYIDMKELREFRTWDIVVEPGDILELNLRYLHPYHWGIIQSGNFRFLQINRDENFF